MAIQYSGNAQTSSFTPSTKQNIIDSVGAALIAASWTTVSGGSGTTAWKLQSATTPQGYAMNVLIKDNGGTCATFSIESADGVLVGGNSTTAAGGWLNPAAGTYKIVCSKYQAFIYVTPNPLTARSFLAFGVPYVPSFLTSSITRVGWMQGNGGTDASTSIYDSFRKVFYSAGASFGSHQAMCNGNLWTSNAGGGNGCIGIAQQANTINGTATNGYRWQSNQAFVQDTVIFWGDTTALVEAKAKGQLWDAVNFTDAYTGDTTGTFDSHNWICVMDNNVTSGQRGTLLIATS